MAPASRFMRALCHHYGVELHNFAPNAISQAATFVGVCEGFLGIPVNWDLWVHLFRGELFTLSTSEQWTRRAVRAGGLSLAVRSQRKDDYIPCTMTTNNAGWERGVVLSPQRRARPPPYTGLVLRERPASWHHGVSPPQHQKRLDSLLAALRDLAGRGLTAEVVLAHLHHRWIVPLMERPLRIFEMTEAADPSRWRGRGRCRAPSCGITRLPGRGAPSTPSPRATTGNCGIFRCCPPAGW
jgi:hypothetical protein